MDFLFLKSDSLKYPSRKQGENEIMIISILPPEVKLITYFETLAFGEKNMFPDLSDMFMLTF